MSAFVLLYQRDWQRAMMETTWEASLKSRASLDTEWVRMLWKRRETETARCRHLFSDYLWPTVCEQLGRVGRRKKDIPCPAGVMGVKERLFQVVKPFLCCWVVDTMSACSQKLAFSGCIVGLYESQANTEIGCHTVGNREPTEVLTGE